MTTTLSAPSASATSTSQQRGFCLRDRVQWTSDDTLKVGLVEEIVPAGQHPSRLQFDTIRDHVSYIVRVPSRGLYWPRVAGLSRA